MNRHDADPSCSSTPDPDSFVDIALEVLPEKRGVRLMVYADPNGVCYLYDANDPDDVYAPSRVLGYDFQPPSAAFSNDSVVVILDNGNETTASPSTDSLASPKCQHRCPACRKRRRRARERAEIKAAAIAQIAPTPEPPPDAPLAVEAPHDEPHISRRSTPPSADIKPKADDSIAEGNPNGSPRIARELRKM